jgi:hypothetical protein
MDNAIKMRIKRRAEGVPTDPAKMARFKRLALPLPKPVEPGLSVLYAEHAPHQCRWPLWPNEPLRSLDEAVFCGAERMRLADEWGVEKALSYCIFHQERATPGMECFRRQEEAA